ncbi:MAG: tRNA adenosine(34) deaminase TadA [Kiritimatiellales bacterium]
MEILPSVFPKAGTQSGVSKGRKTCYCFSEVWKFMDDNFSEDVIYMRMALREAERAAEAGEVPCGAIIVKDGAIIGKAHNQTELLKDPTAHAEILAITQAAAALENWRLTDAVMYVTKEPCPMCAGAIVLARLKKVVWGVDDPKRGGARSKFEILDHADLNHRVEIQTGVMEAECKGLIQGFFRERRKENKANGEE